MSRFLRLARSAAPASGGSVQPQRQPRAAQRLQSPSPAARVAAQWLSGARKGHQERGIGNVLRLRPHWTRQASQGAARWRIHRRGKLPGRPMVAESHGGLHSAGDNVAAALHDLSEGSKLPVVIQEHESGSHGIMDPWQPTLGSQHGYTVRVSSELLGLFRFVERLKRARVKEVADALYQVAMSCALFAAMRGVVGPLIQVFRSQPPDWSKLFMMLSAVDYIAIAYLAYQARKPMLDIVQLAIEPQVRCSRRCSKRLEKLEEIMIVMAGELVRLFKRMRNIALISAIAQVTQLAVSSLQGVDPDLAAKVALASEIMKAWVLAPWN
eukprot:SM000103S09496  [mRNA]  locus=s103:374208:375905:+ [translate_table: standard]